MKKGKPARKSWAPPRTGPFESLREPDNGLMGRPTRCYKSDPFRQFDTTTPRLHLVAAAPSFPILHPPTCGGARREESRRDVGDDGGGALLAGGGDDLHRLLQHLCRAGAELPQGALQVRGRIPREGPLLRRQVGGRQAGEAQ